MVAALAPAFWVTRWLARSMAMLAMTAFTALAVALGAGGSALPAAAGMPAPDAAVSVRPAEVTVADNVAVPLDIDGAGVELVAPAAAAPAGTSPDPVPAIGTDEPAVPVAELAGATATGAVGERAPPGR